MTNETNFIHLDDKQKLIKTLNKKGFMLEYKANAILFQLANDFKNPEKIETLEIESNQVIEFRNERRQIDVFLHKKKYYAIFECKRTEYDWIFPTENNYLAKRRIKYFVQLSEKGSKIQGCSIDGIYTTDYDLAVMFDEERKLKMKGNEVRTSYEDIHRYLRQVLVQTEALTHKIFENRKLKQEFDVMHVYPILITNARLFVMEFNKNKVNEFGDLIDWFNVEEVPFLVYDFPQILKWDSDTQKIKEPYDCELKSIYIVNIRKLKKFIKFLDSCYGY